MAIFMAIFLWLFLLTDVISGFFSLLPLFLAVSLHGCYFAAVSLSSFFRSCFYSSFFMISYLLFQYFFKLSGIQ
jgi:hypothetical protein